MKVKCQFCKTYVEKDDAVQRGIVYYCSEAHIHAAYEEKRKKGAARATTYSRRSMGESSKRGSVSVSGVGSAGSEGKGSNRRPQKTNPKKSHYEFRTEIRDAILEADGYKCRYCHSPYGLHVHHIKYRSEQGPGEKWNGITLCYQCHNIVHSRKKRYQPLCFGLVWLREVEGINNIKILQLEDILNGRGSYYNRSEYRWDESL